MSSPIFRRRILLAATVALPATALLWNWQNGRNPRSTVIEPAATAGAGYAERTTLRPPPPKPAPAVGHAGGSHAMLVTGSAWTTDSEPSAVAFRNWTERYLAASPAVRESLMHEGLAAAAVRRDVMAGLIRTAPEQALASAVPMVVRQALPGEITALLEERVSGRGSVEMLSATPPPGRKTSAAPSSRIALVNRVQYETFTYGRRAQLNYLPDISIIGIALDGALALSDSPVRLLEAGELPDGRAVEENCPVSGITTPVTVSEPLNTSARTAVEAHGRIRVVCNPSHISTLEARLISGEGEQQADGGAGSSGVTGRPSYAWTHGTKKVLIIRVDFSDVPGTPVNNFSNTSTLTPAFAVNAFTDAGGIKDYYEQCSYGQTSLSIAAVAGGVSPDVTPVLRMPATASSYVTVGTDGVGNATLLHADAQALAMAAGYNVANYDRIGAVYSYLGNLPGSKMSFGGLGSTPGKNFWTNGSYEFSIIAHEVGHTYGLNHSSSWLVTDGNPVSPAGSVVEYGDLSDIMGDGSDITNQFNHWNKSIAQWMPDAAVTTVNSAGTYRLYRFDHTGANLANALALKVVRNRTQDYWIGYRRATTAANFNNGAYIVWGANQKTNGLLLDMNTPGVSVDDAPLGVGQTFNDTAAGITLRTTARGGSGASEYLDVQVTFQPRIAWTQSAYHADEQSGSAVLTLSRSNNSTGAVSVHWATTPGTATSPADFTAGSGDVSWADGDGADKTVVIPVAADLLAEGVHAFTVTLSAAAGGVIVDNPAATVNIVDSGINDPLFAASFINSAVTGVIAQPDGNILISGPFSELQESGGIVHARGGIARMTGTGAVDAAFGSAGGAGAGTTVRDIARQPDGKILVAGDFTTMNGTARNRIARLNADGSLDATFNPGTGADDTVRAVLVQPDGKVLIGGSFINFNGNPREYLARLNANGSLDTSFTGPDFGGTNGWRVSSLALQPDGKLLVGGAFYRVVGSSFTGGLCRVTTTGGFDSTFNGITEGSTVLGNPSDIRSVNDIAVQLDGKILVAGDFTAFNAVARGGLARLSDTGAVDAGFAAVTNGECSSVLVQPDGKILVAGTFTTFNGTGATHLVRLSGTGVPDAVFAAAGGPDAPVYALTMQTDGRVLFGSEFTTFQTKGPGPLWRMFSGLPALPGTLQFSSTTAAASEGTDATLSVTRTGGSAGAMSVNYATVTGTAGAADFTSTRGTLSWANGETAAKTIVVPVTTDALTESPEVLTVNIGQPQLGGALLGSTQSIAVTVTDPAAVTPYQTWRNTHFSPAELADSTVSGDHADPDNDSWDNLLEYAAGTLPRTANGSPVVVVPVSSSTVTFTYRRNTAASDVAVTFEHSPSLTSPSWTAVVPASDVLNSTTGTVQTRTATINKGAGTRDFYRMTITLP